MPRMERTIDHNGQVRSGPPGAWWSHLQPRPGGGGFSPEIPAGRAAAWNLFLAVLVLSSALAAHLAGTPWSTLGAVLGGTALGAIPLAVLAYRAAQFRDPWQRHLREQAKVTAVEPRRAPPVRARREAA